MCHVSVYNGRVSVQGHARIRNIFTNTNDMSVLEFIRRNSLLVLIVVFALGLGFLFMDYGDKGNMFGTNFYIQVNGVSYNYQETVNLGENGESYLHSLYSTASQKIRDKFDANEDDSMSDDELAAMNAWLNEHPEYQEYMDFIGSMMQVMAFGLAEDGGVNVAVNRAIIQQVGKDLGLIPSKEQVDAYIKAMPPFQKDDGSFDQDLYHRLTGYDRVRGLSNNTQETAFRSVVSDLIVLECLNNIFTGDVRYQGKAVSDLVDAVYQDMRGKNAWLPAGAVKEPPAPSEEELREFWEENKEDYKSDERRIVSVYTLAPAEGANIESLIATADMLMEDLSKADGKGFDQLLEGAAENPEYEPFTYKTADGKSHTTGALTTLAGAPAELQVQVDHNGKSMSLAEVAFSEVDSAPTVQQYEENLKAGNLEQRVSIKQVRGYFLTKDSKLIFIRVEAIEEPVVLEFDAAREKALADLMKNRSENALEVAANKLFAEMEAALPEGGVDAAFAKAEAAGATVKDFGPTNLSTSADQLPAGVDAKALISVPTGKLAPIAISKEGASITAVTGRTIESSPDYAAAKSFRAIPSENARLRGEILVDWIQNAYVTYKVNLANEVRRPR